MQCVSAIQLYVVVAVTIYMRDKAIWNELKVMRSYYQLI